MLKTTPLPTTGNGQKAVRSALLSSTSAEPKRLFLDIAGLATEGDGRFGYEIYVHPPRGGEVNRDSPSFVGLVQLFGMVGQGAHHGHQTGANIQTFDVSNAALAADTAQP